MANRVELEFRIKSNDQAIKKLNTRLGEFERQSKQSSVTASALTKNIVAIGGAYLSLSAAYEQTIARGIEVNKTFEQLELSIAALATVNARYIGVIDETASATDRFSQSQKFAKEQIAELEIINKQTPQTLAQTVQVYKTLLPQVLQYGGSLEDLNRITKQVALSAAASGVEFNAVLASIDGLASGTFLANSDYGRFLSTVGLTPKKLKESDDSIRLIIESLKDFEALAPELQKSYGASLSNLSNAWDKVTKSITVQVFEDLKVSVNDTTLALEGFTQETKDLEALASAIAIVPKGFIFVFKAFDTGIDQIGIRLDFLVERFGTVGLRLKEAFLSSLRGDSFGEFIADKLGLDEELEQRLRKEVALSDLKLGNLQNTYKEAGLELEIYANNLFKAKENQEKFNDAVKRTEKIGSVGAIEKELGDEFEKAWKKAVEDKNNEKLLQDAIDKYNLEVKKLSIVNVGLDEFEGALKSGVEGALASGINDALNGDFDFQSFANLMQQAVVGAVAQGIAAGAVAGMGTGGLLAVAGGAVAAGSIFGGDGGGGAISTEAATDIILGDILDELQKQTNIFELQGLGGTAAVEELADLAAELDKVNNQIAPFVQDIQARVKAGETIDSGDIAEIAQSYGLELSEVLQGGAIVDPGLLRDQLNEELSTAILESSALFENTGLALADLSISAGNTALEATRVENALSRLGVSTEAEFTSLINAAAEGGEALADAETYWDDLTTTQQDALIAAQNYGEEINILSDYFDIGAESVSNLSDTILGLGDITRNQQSFIDTNLGLIESGADSVERLQARFAEEAAQAEELRATIGEGATAEQLAQLRQEEQDVLELGQALIDKTRETFASTETAESIIAGVIDTVDKNQGELLSVQEMLLGTNNDLLTEIRDALLAQNEAFKAEAIPNFEAAS